MRSRRHPASRAFCPEPSPHAFRRLRTLYFTDGALPAARYGLRFDAVVEHLWQARRQLGLIPLRRIEYLDDILLAIACSQDHAQAWLDLRQLYEPSLVRRYRGRMDPIEALLLVRRFISELRTPPLPATAATADALTVLQRYLGLQPLPVFLANELGRQVRAAGGRGERSGRATLIRRPERVAEITLASSRDALAFSEPPPQRQDSTGSG